MRDAIGTVRRSPDGLVSVQTSWSGGGENVRIIDPATGTAGFQTEDYVADWPVLIDSDSPNITVVTAQGLQKMLADD